MKSSIKISKGFTLIELMITVAIIGILSSIAITGYQNYIVKSLLSSAIHDLASEKTRVELVINENIEMSSNTEFFLSYPESGVCSDISVVESSVLGEKVTLQCIMRGNSLINGKNMKFIRERSSGQWRCFSNVNSEQLPKACSYEP